MKTQLTLEGVECTIKTKDGSFFNSFCEIKHAETGEVIAFGTYEKEAENRAIGLIKKFKNKIEKCFEYQWKREMMLKAIKDFEDGKQTAP